MKKIIVNKEQCIGCGACVAIAPTHFEFDDEGKSTPISQEIIEDESLQNAIESCPTSAISINEVEQTEEVSNKKEESCECNENCENCHHINNEDEINE